MNLRVAVLLIGCLGSWTPGTVAGQSSPPLSHDVRLEMPIPNPFASNPSLSDTLGVSVTPGGAFLRSVLIPGWGHVVTESFTRGGFYATAQSASMWMLWKSIQAKGEGEEHRRIEREILTARLQHQGIVEPEDIRAALQADSVMQNWDSVMESRKQQVEDWVVLTFFMALLGGADAFVSAHLQDYPEPLTFQVRPRTVGGGVEVGFSLPIGGRGIPPRPAPLQDRSHRSR